MKTKNEMSAETIFVYNLLLCVQHRGDAAFGVMQKLTELRSMVESHLLQRMLVDEIVKMIEREQRKE